MPRLQRRFRYDRDILVAVAYILSEVRLSKLIALLVCLASCLVSRPLILVYFGA
jgi:hypothetical protein